MKSQALLPCALPSHNSKASSGLSLRAGAKHFDERRRAADKRGLAGRFVGVLGKRAHERQINMHMRIDEAGENKFARGIDHFRAGGAKCFCRCA